MTRRTSQACVYCDHLADGREDWFPRWLGRFRGMGLLLDRVCDECNQRLGRTLDTAMSRESPQAINRALLEIAGRHGGGANPFNYKNQQAQPPVTMTMDRPAAEFEPLVEIIPGSNPPHSRTVRQLVFRGPDGTIDRIRVNPIGPEADAQWLATAIENHRLEDAQLICIFCEPEDPALPNDQRRPALWLRKALLKAFPQSQLQAETSGIRCEWLVEGEVVSESGRANLRLEVTTDYPRTLGKIAFHYALMVDDDITGREAEFEGIRAFVRDGHGDPNAFVDANAESFVLNMNYALNGTHHFLLQEVNSLGYLVVGMFFFVQGSRMSGAPDVLGIPPIRVMLGRYPYTSSVRRAYAIRLYAGPREGFDGEILRCEVRTVGTRAGVAPPPWAGRPVGM